MPPDPKSDLDRLLSLWSSPKPRSPPPAPPTPSNPPPSVEIPEPSALLQKLSSSIAKKFGEDSRELVIARLLVENETLKEAGPVPIESMSIGDVVQAMAPLSGSALSAKELAKYGDRMADLLDDLEDLLDGLMIAAEAGEERRKALA